MPEDRTDRETAALESALKALAPLSGPLDRDRLMFRLGQASGRRPGWGWPCLSGALALTALGLVVALALRPAPETRIEYVKEFVPTPTPEPTPGPTVPDPVGPSAAEYLRQREQALRWGMDGMPNPTFAIPAERPLAVETLPELPPFVPNRPPLPRHPSPHPGGSS